MIQVILKIKRLPKKTVFIGNTISNYFLINFSVIVLSFVDNLII